MTSPASIAEKFAGAIPVVDDTYFVPLLFEPYGVI